MKNKNNRELFDNALSDAKTIKNMAIENAKKALTESFTPAITKMLSTKLEEMEKEEELEENDLTNESENEIDEAKKAAEEEGEKEESTNENINLDELLAELNEDEELEESEELNEDLDEAKKAEDKDDEDEETDLASMSEEDLADFVKGVVKDMEESGELESEDDEDETEGSEDEEVSIDEILKSLEEGGSLVHKKVNKAAVDNASTEYYEKGEKVKEELNEALKTIRTLKVTINEVNLLNSKLLYMNKIFKAKTLNESQKVKVLNSFDKAKTVSESKVVYSLLMESLSEKKVAIKEHKSIASTVISGAKTTTKQKPILENTDPQIARFQKLAGIK